MTCRLWSKSRVQMWQYPDDWQQQLGVITGGAAASFIAFNAWRLANATQVVKECWFCNHVVAVRSSLATAGGWDCPQCEQYNGFTPSGDYNRDIPSMRLPQASPLHRRRSAHVLDRDGDNVSHLGHGSQPSLCADCAHKQESRIHEIAVLPVDSFDDSVQEDGPATRLRASIRLLESRYNLCASCQNITRKRLESVDRAVKTRYSACTSVAVA